jgi:hypothetical protein
MKPTVKKQANRQIKAGSQKSQLCLGDASYLAAASALMSEWAFPDNDKLLPAETRLGRARKPDETIS